MKKLLIFMDEVVTSDVFDDENRFLIHLQRDRELFEEIDRLYKDSFRKHPYMLFEWRDLSSGEKAMLSMYSRFYDISKSELKENLIVLIDEGEQYLHPQWQKEFIEKVISFLPAVFAAQEGVRNIQIILTSNSPFVVSDLPSSHVVFLAKVAGRTQVLDGLEEHHQTFASNINTLLAHSFFMEGGLMGAFAKRQINRVIQLLVKGSDLEVQENLEFIRKTIHIIGEPLIKNKQLQMHDDRMRMMKTLPAIVDDEIAELKKRIEALERLRES
jgi:predicted ATP-binding protein involved in virulence